MADDAFEAALDARDEDALALECQRRLDDAQYGTGMSFRIGWDHKFIFRCVAVGEGSPKHERIGREAARALLQEASLGR